MKTTIIFASLLFPSLLCAQTGLLPGNDRYLDIQPVALQAGNAAVFTSDNTGATIADDFLPGSIADSDWGVASVWHAFHLETAGTVTIDYCGTEFQQPGAFADYLFPDRPDAREVLQAATIQPSACGDRNYAMTFPDLFAGTYYIAVGYLPGIAEGHYTLTVSATVHPCERIAVHDGTDH